MPTSLKLGDIIRFSEFRISFRCTGMERRVTYRHPAGRVPREPLSGVAHERVAPGAALSGRVVGAATRLRRGRAGPHAVHVRRRRAAEHEPSAGRPAAGPDVREEQRLDRRPVGVHRLAADEHGPQLEPAPDVGPFGLAQPHVVAGRRNAERPCENVAVKDVVGVARLGPRKRHRDTAMICGWTGCRQTRSRPGV